MVYAVRGCVDVFFRCSTEPAGTASTRSSGSDAAGNAAAASRATAIRFASMMPLSPRALYFALNAIPTGTLPGGDSVCTGEIFARSDRHHGRRQAVHDVPLR